MIPKNLDFFTSVTRYLDMGAELAGKAVTTAGSAITKGFGFLDDNPLAKKIAKAAAGSVFATEDVNQGTSTQIPELDYKQANVNTRPSDSILQNPRFQFAVNGIKNRVNTGVGTQKVADMSAPFVRVTKGRMTPMGITRTAIKTSVKQPTTTTRTRTV